MFKLSVLALARCLRALMAGCRAQPPRLQLRGLAARFSLALLVTFAGVGSASLSADQPALAAPEAPVTIYLPLLSLRSETVFGQNVTVLAPERGLNDIVELGTGWLRGTSLVWRDVEPVEGAGYRWDAPSVRVLEQELQYASQHGLRFILVVRGSPAWATKPFRADCAPINAAKYGRFAAFLAAAVARYSQPPFNASYWELGNEPDAPVFASNSGYGCWGVASDIYFGGQAYGAMLKAVYPAMKAAAPQITVLNGGLLLDRPYNSANGSGKMARFLEGMLVAGAGNAFDLLSFHSYSYYNGTVDGTRGLGDWKVSYLRNIFKTYGVPQKPMINTETALLCEIATPECRAAQADWIGRNYARAINDGLIGMLWYLYDGDGFKNTALIDPANLSVRRPAFFAYQTAAALLGDTRLLGPLSGQPAGVEGYRFGKGRQRITVVWSDAKQTVRIPIDPAASISCLNRDGQALVCDAVAGTVAVAAQSSPTYIVER